MSDSIFILIMRSIFVSNLLLSAFHIFSQKKSAFHINYLMRISLKNVVKGTDFIITRLYILWIVVLFIEMIVGSMWKHNNIWKAQNKDYLNFYYLNYHIWRDIILLDMPNMRNKLMWHLTKNTDGRGIADTNII